jgi:TPR repeat protein
MYNLGTLTVAGRGVEKNEAAALEWFRKAAGLGHTEAMYNLGLMYAKGLGTPADIEEAARWFRQAAEKGHEGARKLIAAAEKSAGEEPGKTVKKIRVGMDGDDGGEN